MVPVKDLGCCRSQEFSNVSKSSRHAKSIFVTNQEVIPQGFCVLPQWIKSSFEGVFPQVPGIAPGQAVITEVGNLGQLGQADIAALGHQAGVLMTEQLTAAGRAAFDMLEVLATS